jgi:ABC-2 type transport system ATP-binding protein
LDLERLLATCRLVNCQNPGYKKRPRRSRNLLKQGRLRSASTSHMIDVKNLTKRYVGRTAVDDISFHVGQGEIVGFLGPNGAGKTTTLRMLTSYLPPSSGSVKIAGFDVFRDSLKARRQIGYMPENVPLYEDMRVKEYLRFRAKLKGLSGKDMRERIGKVMDRCGVTDVRKKMISSLSKGYRQRVGLADTLVHSPQLLILDEPTNGLDPNQIRQVRELVKELGRDHTVLISTHILPEVEATCDRVIIINEGKVRASGTPQELVGRLRTAGTISVEIKTDPGAASEKMKLVSGVRKVQKESIDDDGWSRFTLRVEATSDVREELYNMAIANHWPLRELTRHHATLEDVFVEVTQSERV